MFLFLFLFVLPPTHLISYTYIGLILGLGGFMRVSSLRRPLYQQLRPSKIVRQRSNLALAQVNFTSSDSSSSDEHRPFFSSSNQDKDDFYANLDTHKVTHFLRTLTGQPEQALSFFYTARKHGFQHNIQTYVEIVRILCRRDRATEVGLNRILVDLNNNQTNLDFCISDLFDAVLHKIKVEGNAQLANLVSASFIKSCADLKLFEEAADILLRSKDHRVSPCPSSCNFLFKRLIDRGETDAAVALYEQRKSFAFTPNLSTYNILIKAYCRLARLEGAFGVLDEIEVAGINPNEYTYNYLIEGLCSNRLSDFAYKNLINRRREENAQSHDVRRFAFAAVIRGFCNEMKVKEAEDVLEHMEKKQGLIPDAYCLTPLISACYKSGKFKQAISLHDHYASSKGLKTDCVILSCILQCLCSLGRFSEAVDYFHRFKDSGIFVDAVCYNVVVDALCKLGRLEEAKKLSDEMEAPPDLIHYSTLINGYCRHGKIKEALDEFKKMKTEGLEPDTILYNILLGSLFRKGFADNAWSLLRHMKAQGLGSNSSTHKTVIEGLCIAGKVKEAETYFSGLEDKCLEIYSAMVSGYCDASHPMDAFSLVSMSSQKGILAKKKTCFKLLRKLLDEGHTQEGLVLFKNLLAYVDSPSVKMCSKFIAAFFKAGDIRSAKLVFDCWVTRGFFTDAVMYTIMIDCYCKANMMPEAHHLFDQMRQYDISPDVVTYSALIHGYMKSSFQLAQFHQRNEQKSKLAKVVFALRKKMAEDKIKPDVLFYTILVHKHCQLNDLDGALELFQEMEEMGLKPDLVTYTALLGGCCKSGDVNRAAAIVEEIKDRGLIDQMKRKGTGRDEIFFSVMEHAIIKEAEKTQL